MAGFNTIGYNTIIQDEFFFLFLDRSLQTHNWLTIEMCVILSCFMFYRKYFLYLETDDSRHIQIYVIYI